MVSGRLRPLLVLGHVNLLPNNLNILVKGRNFNFLARVYAQENLSR